MPQQIIWRIRKAHSCLMQLISQGECRGVVELCESVGTPAASECQASLLLGTPCVSALSVPLCPSALCVSVLQRSLCLSSLCVAALFVSLRLCVTALFVSLCLCVTALFAYLCHRALCVSTSLCCNALCVSVSQCSLCLSALRNSVLLGTIKTFLMYLILCTVPGKLSEGR
eukprot:1160989-Pelagomonas_calceolata.AAC.11